MTEIYPHEAWCPHCHVSHPLGTRQCLHCGGPVMPARPIQGMRSAPRPRSGPIEIPRAPEIVPVEEAEQEAEMSRIARPLRLGVAGIWIVLAVAGAILRACAERG